MICHDNLVVNHITMNETAKLVKFSQTLPILTLRCDRLLIKMPEVKNFIDTLLVLGICVESHPQDGFRHIDNLIFL